MKRVFIISLAVCVLTATAACAADVAEKKTAVAAEQEISAVVDTFNEQIGTGTLPAKHDGIAPEDYPVGVPILIYSEDDKLCPAVERYLKAHGAPQEHRVIPDGEGMEFVKWTLMTQPDKFYPAWAQRAAARFDIDNDGVDENVTREMYFLGLREQPSSFLRSFEQKYDIETLLEWLRTGKGVEKTDGWYLVLHDRFSDLEETDAFKKNCMRGTERFKTCVPLIDGARRMTHAFSFDDRFYVLGYASTELHMRPKPKPIYFVVSRHAAKSKKDHICYFLTAPFDPLKAKAYLKKDEE